MAGGDVFDGGSLVELDFEKNSPAGDEALGGAGEDAAMDDQPIEPAVERGERLVVADVAVEFFNLCGRHIRGVGDDQMKRLRIGLAGDGIEEIAGFDGDAITQAEAFDVTPRDGDGGLGDVGREDGRVLESMRNGGGDAGGAGAEVQDARGFEAGLVARELDDVFHECFGVGSRDEHVPGDFEFEVEEVGAAGEVGDGFVFGGALDEGAECGELLFGQDAFVIGVQFDARDVEHVREEQFRGETRAVYLFACEKRRGPFQQPPDRPWPAGVGHGANCRRRAGRRECRYNRSVISKRRPGAEAPGFAADYGRFS